MTRREFLVAGAAWPLALGSSGAAPPRGGAGARSPAMIARAVPSSGEALPVIGLGTWRTFDAGPSAAERAPLRDVLTRLFRAGGRVLDSSPMYGRAEEVVGDLLRGTPHHSRAFVATKVWTSGKAEGEAQMAESERKMGGRLDLVQVHNLVDWKTQLPTVRAWKEAGRIRYSGITHYSLASFDEMERILRTERVDFVQLPYSAATREAEARLLPTARDSRTAVIVMRPFEGGELLRGLRGKPLPSFAADAGATTWAQLLLKFIVSHPAVTVAIPATSKPEHLDDNVRAGTGRLLDAGERKKLLTALGV